MSSKNLALDKLTFRKQVRHATRYYLCIDGKLSIPRSWIRVANALDHDNVFFIYSDDIELNSLFEIQNHSGFQNLAETKHTLAELYGRCKE